MTIINMILQSYILTIFIHYAVSYNINSEPERTNDIHRKFVERTYNTRPRAVTDSDSVGEPLILTTFIESKKIAEARKAARVDDEFLLPGTESYAGYLTVNKKYNGNLWFWYFPVAGNKSVSESPLILWLQGGPGASSLFGLFVEIGPFTALNNGTLKENKYTWVKNHSLLFIDNPVGTGFSFTDKNGYAKSQTTIAENLYTALQQFLTIFPELRTAPLFIAGESYAGKHIPSIAIQIHWHKGKDEPINLQGLAIGNGLIDPETVLRYSYLAREVGLVDDKIADTMKFTEDLITKAIGEGQPEAALYVFNGLLELFSSESHLLNIYNYMKDDTNMPDDYNDFVQKSEIRRALHVGNTTFANPRKVYVHLVADIMNSVKPWLEELLNDYRVLVYSGHLDCMVPYHASVNTYKSLNFSNVQEFTNAKRYPWYHNRTLAGYFKTGGNLLEVMVRGAGHMVPFDKPPQALGLISAFVRGIPLDHDTGNLVG